MKRRPALGPTTFALLCTVVALSGSQAPAQQNSQPSWEFQNGRLVYGWPGSDVVSIIITCRRGMADVDIMVRPPRGKAGDKTTSRRRVIFNWENAATWLGSWPVI
jgi:hypothetical protein